MTTGILIYLVIYLFLSNLMLTFRLNVYTEKGDKKMNERLAAIFSVFVMIMFFAAVGAGLGYAIAAFTGMV